MQVRAFERYISLTMFQSNILSGVYIDDYIMIHWPRFDNYF